MRELGQPRSELLTWSVPTLQGHLVALYATLAHEAQEKGEMYKALGPIGALFGGAG